jgi:hypothetical protein
MQSQLQSIIEMRREILILQKPQVVASQLGAVASLKSNIAATS